MGLCCSKAHSNKTGANQKISAAPQAQPGASNAQAAGHSPTTAAKVTAEATGVSQKKAMDDYVEVYTEKAVEILKEEKEQATHYLMHPNELLKKVRESTRFKATPLLTAAFTAFDTEGGAPDGVLSVTESDAFITAYCVSVEKFLSEIYKEGLSQLDGKVDLAEADRVGKMFKSEGAAIRQIFHQASDKNGDGQLQLIEVKHAFLGNKAGPVEEALSKLLTKEFEHVLFGEGV